MVPTPAAYAEDRITTAIPENTVLAMKQVYVPVDRDLAEKIWKREAELLFDYRYRILADPLASATICVPVDAFRYPTDGGMKVLMRIVMFRSRESAATCATASELPKSRPLPASNASRSSRRHH